MNRAPCSVTDAAVQRPSRRPALTAADVTAILNDFAAGTISIRALALRHDVGETAVRAVLTGERHAEIPGPRLAREEIAALGARHIAEGRRVAGKRAQKAACPGCGEPGHAITRCPNPKGK